MRITVAAALAVSAVAACGSSEATSTAPPSGVVSTAPAPVAPRPARVELRAALAGNVTITGAIHADSVNAAFTSVAPGIGRCASEATERGVVVQSVATRVAIAHDGALSEATATATPAADAPFSACVEAALRAQRFPEPLGPPVPDFEIPAGHSASEYLVANATATYALAAR